MSTIVAGVVIGGALVAGICSRPAKSRFGENTIERPGLVPVQAVEEDDPRINAAIAEARASVQRFIAAFEQPPPNSTGFAIKRAFFDGDEQEHFWLVPIAFRNGRFVATVSNEPLNVHTVRMGQQVEVAPEEISDWMYLDQGKLVGGYTVRAIRDSFDDARKRDFDRQVPFIIE